MALWNIVVLSPCKSSATRMDHQGWPLDRDREPTAADTSPAHLQNQDLQRSQGTRQDQETLGLIKLPVQSACSIAHGALLLAMAQHEWTLLECYMVLRFPTEKMQPGLMSQPLRHIQRTTGHLYQALGPDHLPFRRYVFTYFSFSQRKLGSNTSVLRTNRILRLEMMQGGRSHNNT